VAFGASNISERGKEKISLMRVFILVCLALLGLAFGIYGPNHWSHSKELTNDNFDSFISTNLDEGKTVMVRFIASEG
jgi:hypothetical protein